MIMEDVEKNEYEHKEYGLKFSNDSFSIGEYVTIKRSDGIEESIKLVKGLLDNVTMIIYDEKHAQRKTALLIALQLLEFAKIRGGDWKLIQSAYTICRNEKYIERFESLVQQEQNRMKENKNNEELRNPIDLLSKEEKEKLLSDEHYEMVNSPKHYNTFMMEAYKMAEHIYGSEWLAIAAEITAFFYQIRMGTKPDNSTEQECAKRDWWIARRDEMLAKLPQDKVDEWKKKLAN